MMGLKSVFIRSLLSNKKQMRAFSSGSSSFPILLRDKQGVPRLECLIQYLDGGFRKKFDEVLKEHGPTTANMIKRHGRNLGRMALHHIRLASNKPKSRVKFGDDTITLPEILEFERELLEEDKFTKKDLEFLTDVFASFRSEGANRRAVYLAGIRNMLWAWRRHGEGTTLKRKDWFILSKELFDKTVILNPSLGLVKNTAIMITNFTSKYFQEIFTYVCGQGIMKKAYFTEGVIGVTYCEVEKPTGGYFNANVKGHANIPNNCFWLMDCVSQVMIPQSPMSHTKLKKLVDEADLMTKLSLTRWTADWTNATFLYEQAANGFRLAKKYYRAMVAFKKASKGQEMLGGTWHAAEFMELAGDMAKELSEWNEVVECYKRAAQLYIEAGRSQVAFDALTKGARSLEDKSPDEAIQLYVVACDHLEEDGNVLMTFDLYRAAVGLFVKLEKYTDAATFLLRWAVAADKFNVNDTHSQCEAYLGAIMLYLYAHDFQQAETCHKDCCQVEAFFKSEQNRAATKLLSEYTDDGDAEEIKRAAQSIISNLYHVDEDEKKD